MAQHGSEASTDIGSDIAMLFLDTVCWYDSQSPASGSSSEDGLRPQNESGFVGYFSHGIVGNWVDELSLPSDPHARQPVPESSHAVVRRSSPDFSDTSRETSRETSRNSTYRHRPGGASTPPTETSDCTSARAHPASFSNPARSSSGAGRTQSQGRGGMSSREWRMAERPETCGLCPMRFPYARDLARHYLQRHKSDAEARGMSTERLKCPVPLCHTDFQRADNLKRHMQNKHGWEKKTRKRRG